MKINKENTCIIFGTSPFINVIGDDNINKIINNYISFGINYFPIKYSNIKYWIWSDLNLYDKFKEHISSQTLLLSKCVIDREVIDDINNYDIEYIYDINNYKISHNIENKELFINKTTAHAAINYAYLLGYKNIVLCGIDLQCNWNYFNENEGITREEKRIKSIRESLYEFKKYVNLYTLNQDSDLEIQKIKTGDLIK